MLFSTQLSSLWPRLSKLPLSKLPKLPSLTLQLAADSDTTLDIGQHAQDVMPYAEHVTGDNRAGGVVYMIGTALKAAMVIAAILLLLYLVWGAIEWITSGGDSGKVESARNRIMQALVGILVLASVIAIFNFVQNFLGINVLNISGSGGGNWSDGGSEGSGGSGGSGGGGGNHGPCKCGNNAGYANVGDIGPITYPDGNCYRCTKNGWVRHEQGDDNCPVTNCSP
jgi:hypothetical protein